MKHLQMDKDALLRKQVHDEVQSQFDARLREARRGKTQAEEDLEQASEKWRTERRKLNTEIDRLEAALAEAREKQVRKGGAAARPASGIDPVEVAKMRSAAEERLSKAAREWEVERNRLLSQHARLEKALTEAIERSNNPLRSNQRITEHFEQKLKDAVQSREQIEERFRKAERDWAEEKLRLTGKMVRIRKSDVQTNAAAQQVTRTQESAQLKELQEKLTAVESRSQSEREEFRKHTERLEIQLSQAGRIPEQLQQKIGSLESRIQEDQRRIQSLENAVSDARKQAGKETAEKVRKEYEARTEELIQQKMDLSQELHALREHMESERTRMALEMEKARNSAHAHAADTTAQVRKEYEARTEELIQQKMDLSQELHALRERMESDRTRMALEIEQLRNSAQTHATGTADEFRKEYDSRTEELTRQKMDLLKELNALKEQMESERTRMISEIEKVQGNSAPSGTNSVHDVVVQSEVQRVEVLIQEVMAVIDDPATELAMVIRKNVQKAELDAYLRGILFSIGQGEALA